MLKVTYYNRDQRAGNFSIEELFGNIKNHLPKNVSWSDFFLDPSKSRFANILSAKKFEGDVNHITGDINYISIGLSAKKTILTVHDLGYFENPVHSALTRAIYRLFWLAMPFRKVKYITTVSEFTKSKILHYFSIDAAKIKVIPNPIDPGYIAVPKAFNTAKPVILAIGTGDHKNFARLIEAVKGIDCALCFIGKLSEGLLLQLKNNNIQYENYFHISREEVIQKYVSADMLFFASLYEGFGMPIVEANAVGRAVITSNCAAMPEVAGDAAIIVDPYSVSEIKQAIETLISDPVKRETLIMNGFSNCKRFDMKTIVAKYAALYSEIHERK